tara:strand:+ start:4017 stop:4946 length:930 start_codon:yes stop_codon:yes gene_type:complete
MEKDEDQGFMGWIWDQTKEHGPRIFFDTATSWLTNRANVRNIQAQADLANEQTEKQYLYDLELWDLNTKKVQKSYIDTLRSIRRLAEKENTIADFSDSVKVANYNQELQIRNKRQEALNAQYERSDSIFKDHISFNSRTAQLAREDELRKIEEIKAEATFDANSSLIEHMELKGKMQAIGVSGNTHQKAASAAAMKYGQNVAMLNASLENAEYSTERTLKEIELDRSAANLSAFASRMLDPGEELMPIKPFATPRTEYELPDPLEDYDFGVPPIPGVYYDPSSQIQAANWSTIGGVAGEVGDILFPKRD